MTREEDAFVTLPWNTTRTTAHGQSRVREPGILPAGEPS
jgi:hypothetical protein